MRRTCVAEGSRIERWREQGSGTGATEEARPTTTFPAAVATAPEDIGSAWCTRANATAPASEEVVATVVVDVFPSAPVAPVETAALPALPALAAAQAFREAPGALEFLTDGTSVNTTGGWKELRIALWLKRPLAEPAEPCEWMLRPLPKTTARSVLIDVAAAETFGARWRPWSGALAITDSRSVHVLADGAEWIWNQAEIQFPGARGTLDVYHAMERLAGAAKAIYGAESGAATAWSNAGTNWLIAKGWAGVCRWVAAVRADCGDDPQSLAETESLMGYISKHVAHLDYAEHLAQGRSIGSGPVEGAAKQLVGRRLKQTGARWVVTNTIKMATLCSCEYAEDWDDYWQPYCQLTAA